VFKPIQLAIHFYPPLTKQTAILNNNATIYHIRNIHQLRYKVLLHHPERENYLQQQPGIAFLRACLHVKD